MLKALNKKNKYSTSSCSGGKAFTLIELLVVIAIIGLLSTIAVASLSNSKEKARIAAGQHFSGSIRSGLGYYIVGEWNFNDGSGVTAKDTSGYDNDGIIHGATPTINCISGNCLGFDGNDYVNCGNGASLKVDDKSFTLEAWIKPKTNIGTNGRFTVMAFYHPGWIMDLPDDSNIEGYRFYNGATTYKYTPPGGLISLEWTNFVVSRDLTTNKLRIYLNGELKQTWNMASVTASANPLLIGRRSDGAYFNGLIDEVRVYSTALTIGQIQQNYAEGLDRHRNLAMETSTH